MKQVAPDHHPWDVVVVGGGPAGLSTAISAALHGLTVAVLERRRFPIDKPCGEGVMPRGVALLDRLGVRSLLPEARCAPIRAIRYVQEDGTRAEGVLRSAGMGIRRTALSHAMRTRAAALESIALWEGRAVRSARSTGSEILVATDRETLRARVLVAADGLASPLRKAAGLELPSRGPRRFGLRQHFAVPSWTDAVEVHLSEDAEAYVTPCGRAEVGVAFLFDPARVGWAKSDGSRETPARSGASARSQAIRLHAFGAVLLERFPLLRERLNGVVPTSVAQGAGPFRRAARAVVADRLALVGDAAGYVDALTGEGVALALESGWELGRRLPEALVKGGPERALAAYQRHWRARFSSYALAANALLGLARRPRFRGPAVRWLGDHPRVFERLIRSFTAG